MTDKTISEGEQIRRQVMGDVYVDRVLANPLIISVIIASPFAYFAIGLPKWLETSGSYLAQMTLPLA
ncbi:hypothetical protein B1F70_08620, partial [Pseudomonas syringae]